MAVGRACPHRSWLLLELVSSAHAAAVRLDGSDEDGGGGLLDGETARHLVQGCLAEGALPQQDAFLDDLLLRCRRHQLYQLS